MTRGRMRARLATEWEAMGWEWDLEIGGLILDRIEAAGTVDAKAIADGLQGSYPTRYGATREELAETIGRAIGGETLDAEAPAAPVSVIVGGDTYNLSFELGDQARIESSNFSIGPGTQVNLDLDVGREDVLGALEALIRAGFAGNWESGAAEGLATVLERRDDIDATEVKELTESVGQDARPSPDRVRALLEQVATGAATSTLAAGLTAGLGHLLSNPPF